MPLKLKKAQPLLTVWELKNKIENSCNKLTHK